VRSVSATKAAQRAYVALRRRLDAPSSASRARSETRMRRSRARVDREQDRVAIRREHHGLQHAERDRVRALGELVRRAHGDHVYVRMERAHVVHEGEPITTRQGERDEDDVERRAREHVERVGDVVRDARFVAVVVDHTGDERRILPALRDDEDPKLRRHHALASLESSSSPSNTKCAGPRMSTCSPGSPTRITSRPPGRRTSIGMPRSARPVSTAATAAAHAPVPHAIVQPEPRSYTARSMPVSPIVAKPAFTPSGKRGSFSTSGAEHAPIFADLVEGDEVRVAHRDGRARERSPADVERRVDERRLREHRDLARHERGHTHLHLDTGAFTLTREHDVADVRPRVGADVEAARRETTAHEMKGHAAKAVAAHLGDGAVCVEHAHRGRLGLDVHEQHAIAADAEVPITQRSHEVGDEGLFERSRTLDDEEVVAETFVLGEAEAHHAKLLDRPPITPAHAWVIDAILRGVTAHAHPRRSPFLVGLNYPWAAYGWDFGPTPYGEGVVRRDAAKIGRALDTLAESKITVLRWFVGFDGRNLPSPGTDIRKVAEVRDYEGLGSYLVRTARDAELNAALRPEAGFPRRPPHPRQDGVRPRHEAVADVHLVHVPDARRKGARAGRVRRAGPHRVHVRQRGAAEEALRYVRVRHRRQP
jgi:hypothetical protein